MILLTRAASEFEIPRSLGYWHDMVARYFALGIALKCAAIMTDRDADEHLSGQGGRPLVPEFLGTQGGAAAAHWPNQRQQAIVRRDLRRRRSQSYTLKMEVEFRQECSRIILRNLTAPVGSGRQKRGMPKKHLRRIAEPPHKLPMPALA